MKSFIEIIKAKLNADERFHYHGKGANEGLWATREKGDNTVGELIHLKKNLANKGYGAFEILLFQEDENGLEIKIQMYVPSYCEWDTFFEGFAENENDFDRIMVMLGIN